MTGTTTSVFVALGMWSGGACLRGRSRGDYGRRGRAVLHFRTALPASEASQAPNITPAPASR